MLIMGHLLAQALRNGEIPFQTARWQLAGALCNTHLDAPEGAFETTDQTSHAIKTQMFGSSGASHRPSFCGV